MKKIWDVKERKHKDIVKQLLENRGVLEDDEKFLNPDFERDLEDPTLLPNFKTARSRIIKAHKNKEKVGIFADYDADGIPGAAFLKKTFDLIGIDCEVYIPSREEGYGLKKSGIDYLVEKGCSLVISIDLGIRDIESAKYCKKKKIDLIITDHHLPGDKLPDALAVVNPKVKGSRYPFKDLSGAGVVFKLVCGLSKDFKKIDEKFLKWNIDLIAISTISDVVPLTGENRLIAKYGLVVLKKTKNIGLQELYKVAEIDNSKMQAYMVGFQIGPRINAPGRMDNASKSYQILVTEDKKKAKELAYYLDDKNKERQLLMDQIFKEACQKIEDQKIAKEKIIIVAGDWSKGVLGPTASRLTDVYSRPVVLFSRLKGSYSGSARSINEINIVEVFEAAKSTILRFGGHKGAAGVSVERGKYEDFKKAVKKRADKNITDKDLQKRLKIDAAISFKEIHKYLFDDIQKLEPYGMGNPKPVFMSENIELKYHYAVGRDKSHMSFTFSEMGKEFRAICFGYKECSTVKFEKKKFDIAFQIMENIWNGKRKLELQIVDIR